MTKRTLNHFDIIEAKNAFCRGENLTDLLKKQKNIGFNTPEIIETAYDLQAGSYIKYVKDNPNKFNSYISEMTQILDQHFAEDSTVLDIGTGELTTLTNVFKNLTNQPERVLAFDLSWSRIFEGSVYANQELGQKSSLIDMFVADIHEIPLCDKSIDITISSHALEPNGETLKNLMQELFRITREKLILFEPCYEINSEEGKRRMDRLGYIKNIDGVVSEFGGKIIEKINVKSAINPLNPTVCFIIAPPQSTQRNVSKKGQFSVPGTDLELEKFDDFYFSKKTGLCFPVLKGIPILKSSCSILASALSR